MILGPDSAPLTDSLLSGLHSPNTRRSYARAIADLSLFAKGKPITRAVLLRWRKSMTAALSSATVNARLSAIRKLIREAFRARFLSADAMTDLLSVGDVPRRGIRMGNWLTLDLTRRILRAPDRNRIGGKRDFCVLAILIGCALRRDELAALDLAVIQQREGRWVFADIEGKGGRVRTVAIPTWVKVAIDEWTTAAKITSGKLIRRISLDPAGLSTDAIWQIVKKYAEQIGVHVGPHDLRRTCAKLCRSHGGSLEQIQIMLGHASIQTTERYLGSTQNLTNAVNDNLGL